MPAIRRIAHTCALAVVTVTGVLAPVSLATAAGAAEVHEPIASQSAGAELRAAAPALTLDRSRPAGNERESKPAKADRNADKKTAKKSGDKSANKADSKAGKSERSGKSARNGEQPGKSAGKRSLGNDDAGLRKRESHARGLYSAPAPEPPSSLLAAAVGTAMAQRGDAYSYGAAGPHAFDCSGLVYFAYRAAGFDVPRTSGAQAAHTRRIDKGDMQTGDLMFFSGSGGVYHVGIFLRWDQGAAVMLHAPSTGRSVVIEPAWTSSWFGGTLR